VLANKKVTVVLPAYNAARTLKQTFDEIPHDIVDDIILTDDASKDETVAMARSLGIPPSTRGAVVAEVQPDSPAAKAGLQPGDVIVEVNRKPVASADAAAAAMHAPTKREHLLRVIGPNGARFVTVTLP